MANPDIPLQTLHILDSKDTHAFKVPTKRIHDGDDVSFFLASKGYADIMTFILQLNASMFPRTGTDDNSTRTIIEWTIENPHATFPPVIANLSTLLEALGNIIDDTPPDAGPRRFGNISFRKWFSVVEERISDLLDEHVSPSIFPPNSEVPAKVELQAYLLGSFGSAQRLDYGTGHELSFLAFLGCLWKLGAFSEAGNGDAERGIVLGILEPYLRLVRRLILTYTLEPAGSHGVWGLDDHSFLPYIFGSAQFSPAVSTAVKIPTEGSLANAPNPTDVANANVVQRERQRNMYFSAIGFIYDVKRGPFWEHSPILYDISGVKAGWAKINKGMLKMYNAEVLSKFPVVQHFPFGSLFVWERDPNAKYVQASIHTAHQPKATVSSTRPKSTSLRRASNAPSTTSLPNSNGNGRFTQAPWLSDAARPAPGSATTAPWVNSRNPTTAPKAPEISQNTRAPWAETKH